MAARFLTVAPLPGFLRLQPEVASFCRRALGRERKVESAAFVFLTFKPYLAVKIFGQYLYEVKTEART